MKYKKPVTTAVIFLLITAVIIITAFLNLPEPKIALPDRIRKEYTHSLDKDSLHRLFGRNKVIPSDLDYPALIALSRYPELINVPIEFRYEKTSFPYAARPEISSMLTPGSRKYVIYIDPVFEKNKALSLQNMPLNAQIGILGHELGHIAYYIRKNAAELFCTGVCYYLPPFRKRFEKGTDLICIYHGLGWQLLRYSVYTRENLDAGTDWAKKYYLSPEEILRILIALPEYQPGHVKDQQEKTAFRYP